jgi:hypothetical protein
VNRSHFWVARPHFLEAAGHAVEEAANGLEAMQAAPGSTVGLVITHGVMLEKEGLETMRGREALLAAVREF